MESLVRELSKLPGIGRKSAQKLAYHFLNEPRESVVKLARALVDIKDKIKTCKSCFNIADSDICPLCSNLKRDKSKICVVEQPFDINTIEKTSVFNGVYHVLNGVISPLDGIGPDELNIKELVSRLDENVREVIVAVNPSREGEATALYLSRILKPKGIRVSKLARGLPIGGYLEHADEVTIGKALEGRIQI